MSFETQPINHSVKRANTLYSPQPEHAAIIYLNGANFDELITHNEGRLYGGGTEGQLDATPYQTTEGDKNIFFPFGIDASVKIDGYNVKVDDFRRHQCTRYSVDGGVTIRVNARDPVKSIIGTRAVIEYVEYNFGDLVDVAGVI